MGKKPANYREVGKENEENACKAFLVILKKIKGVEYIKKCRPEKSNSETKDVDFILAPKDEDCQSPKIAVEHTIVEAHEKQSFYAKQLGIIEKKIDRGCQGKLPADRCFGLTAPPSLIIEPNQKIRDQFVEEMTCWIPRVAKTLTTGQESSRLYNRHEVSLECVGSCSELNGTVGMTSDGLERTEKQRQDRFSRSLKNKLPKLLKYKEKEEEFETVFLLEDVSLAYSNPGDNRSGLIPNKYYSQFQLIDYVVIFGSCEKKMIMGLVWKEKDKLYSTIPEDRIFFNFNQ